MDSARAYELAEQKKRHRLQLHGKHTPGINRQNHQHRRKIVASVLGLLLGLIFALAVGVYSVVTQRQVISEFSSTTDVIGITTSE